MDGTLCRRGEYTFLPQERIHFGAGSLERLAAEVELAGSRRAFVITGRTLATQTPLIRRVEAILGERRAGTFAGIRQHVPEGDIAEALRQARAGRADLLVSVGGGSPIDAAKAVARQLLAGSNTAAGRSLPHVAIPTTLSAAEFSHLAGFTEQASRSKVGFADPAVTPRAVILDPEMTLHTPMELWLASGLRALDHAVETLYTPGCHPINDVLALQAIQALFEHLPRCKAEPEDLEARLECQLAAWMSYFGPASANAARGLSHTLGKRIGATYGVPHGVTSCILLPQVMAAKAETPDAARLAPAARRLGLAGEGASDREAALEASRAVADLVRQLELPTRLREVHVPQQALEQVARSLDGDEHQQEQALAILRQAW